MKKLVKLYGGIEGGGTHTKLSLFDQKANLVCLDSIGTTNPWLLGRENNEDGFGCCARLIVDLIDKSLKQLNENSKESNYKLLAVGICLSGGGCKSIHDRVINAMKKYNVNYEIYVGNDSLSSMFTAFKNGGLVLISGTGSKCVLVNPIEDQSKLTSFDDINSLSSGGWGNMLGDEGSAYWIAQKGIKFVIDYNDNFLIDMDHVDENNTTNEKVEELKKLIFAHFNVKTLDDLLPHFYTDFKKDNIASLTEKLALLAESNFVVRGLFEDSGFQLARHIVAILPKIDAKLLHSPGGLPIICVGSVFKSWSLIKPGFLKCLKAQTNKLKCVRELNLVVIKDNSSIGAAILASRIYDYQNELGQFVELSSFTQQLDHLLIKLNNDLLNENFNGNALNKSKLDNCLKEMNLNESNGLKEA